MRIVGKWHTCNDGINRPIVETSVLSATGQPVFERFLVDSCADCTVLSADLLKEVQLTAQAPPAGVSLSCSSPATISTRLARPT
jgi:hypothetical protein